MADFKVKIYKGNETHPISTVTIPAGVLKMAPRVMPRKAQNAMREKGIDLDGIIQLADDPAMQGTILLEVEDRKADERVVICLE